MVVQEALSHCEAYQNIADIDPELNMSFLNKHDVIFIPFIRVPDSCCQHQEEK